MLSLLHIKHLNICCCFVAQIQIHSYLTHCRCFTSVCITAVNLKLCLLLPLIYGSVSVLTRLNGYSDSSSKVNFFWANIHTTWSPITQSQDRISRAKLCVWSLRLKTHKFNIHDKHKLSYFHYSEEQSVLSQVCSVDVFSPFILCLCLFICINVTEIFVIISHFSLIFWPLRGRNMLI